MHSLNIRDDWHEKKGKLKQQFAQLTDNDLQYEKGQEEELIGRIRKRLGVPREIAVKIIRYS